MNALAFERRVAELGGALTPEETARLAMQEALTHAANDGMRDDWLLRQRARRILTEAHLAEIVATVPIARRALIEARMRPYTSIGLTCAERQWQPTF